MSGRVNGKMAFVTGAAQGLGEAISHMLAKKVLRLYWLILILKSLKKLKKK